MTMIRARAAAASAVPMRSLYSVRTPAELYYAGELQERARAGDGLDVAVLYTRAAPPGETRGVGRLAAADLAAAGWPFADPAGRAYVCGPTGFVEAAAQLLLAAGGAPAAIRTERFGPSGTSAVRVRAERPRERPEGVERRCPTSSTAMRWWARSGRCSASTCPSRC